MAGSTGGGGEAGGGVGEGFSDSCWILRRTYRAAARLIAMRDCWSGVRFDVGRGGVVGGVWVAVDILASSAAIRCSNDSRSLVILAMSEAE